MDLRDQMKKWIKQINNNNYYFWQNTSPGDHFAIQDCSASRFSWNSLLNTSINGWNDMGDQPMFLRKGWKDRLFEEQEVLPDLV